MSLLRGVMGVGDTARHGCQMCNLAEIPRMCLLRHRLCHILLFMAVWMGLAMSLIAAEGIDDQAGILTKQALSDLELSIKSCREQTGVHVQLITLSELQDQLQPIVDRELQKRPSDVPILLIVFAWGKERAAIKPSVALGGKYPVYQQTELIKEADNVFADASKVLSERIEKAVQTLTEGYQRIHQEQIVNEIRYYPNELFIALACVVIGATLLMWTALRWLQQSSARPKELYFPDVEVEMRLGAPYGGGTLAYTPGRNGK